MSTREYDLIAAAYVNLLRLPFGSPRRLALQSALCALRDELALTENKDAEYIQTRFEHAAHVMDNQQPLSREFEKVLFDNIWELYAR